MSAKDFMLNELKLAKDENLLDDNSYDLLVKWCESYCDWMEKGKEKGGMMIVKTLNILHLISRLLNGLPLTPIQDGDGEWEQDETFKYHKRCASIIKKDSGSPYDVKLKTTIRFPYYPEYNRFLLDLDYKNFAFLEENYELKIDKKCLRLKAG